jgi:hypothetical protein
MKIRKKEEYFSCISRSYAWNLLVEPNLLMLQRIKIGSKRRGRNTSHGKKNESLSLPRSYYSSIVDPKFHASPKPFKFCTLHFSRARESALLVNGNKQGSERC